MIFFFIYFISTKYRKCQYCISEDFPLAQNHFILCFYGKQICIGQVQAHIMNYMAIIVLILNTLQKLKIYQRLL